jgi:uncharacterized protein (TIGR01777 family)
MRITIAGGTGLLGRALACALRGHAHEVTVLTRRARVSGDLGWDPGNPSGAWAESIRQADAVVNLAGEPLDEGRWTSTRKQAILDSRVRTTRVIAEVLASVPRASAAFLNASAVGYYGNRGDELVTEATPAGDDFLATVCKEWEREAAAAAGARRVVLLRTGLVLARSGGALPRLERPFRLFAGGRVGSGRQWWPWIHLEDWVTLVMWALAQPNLSGPLNLTAPNPVTNAEFARILGRTLKRPAIVQTPAFALRIALGEMADALVLSGQRVIPERAMQGGFRFRYPDLERALTSIYR